MHKYVAIAVVVLLLTISNLAHATATPTPTPTGTPTQTPTPTATPTPGPDLNLTTGTNGFKGYIKTDLELSYTPAGGAAPWAPLYLPTDDSEYVLVSFHVNGSSITPSTYQLIINGRCPPSTQGGNPSGCLTQTIPIKWYCQMSGLFIFNFVANNYGSVPKSVMCVPPEQLPRQE